MRAYYEAPLEHLHSLLGTATSRIIYDCWAYFKTRHEASPRPVWSSTLSRDTHMSQLVDGQRSRITVGIAYSDGFARTVQKKHQAEPGPLCRRTDTLTNSNGHSGEETEACNERWVGSGWVIYNNKGNPVREFEPFFTGTHRFESDVRVGVEHHLAVRCPPASGSHGHAGSHVVQGCHGSVAHTVVGCKRLGSRTTPESRSRCRWLLRTPGSGGLPSQLVRSAERRPARERGAENGKKAAVHADTPRMVCLDALGNIFVGFETIKTQRSDCSRPTVETGRNRVIS